MAAPRTPEQSLALLRRETRLREGFVSAELDGVTVPAGRHHFAGDAFLLHADCGTRFFYHRGAGVVMDRPRASDPAAAELWFNGSVYAAVACLNGFMPLHASAVEYDGAVTAFTGPAGAGKSTLAAALGQVGMSLFCDDTLLLDLANLDLMTCMPGHKRLKLLPDALTLTGATPLGPVGSETGKYYAQPPAGAVATPLPLARLVFLADGADLAWRPLRGADRFARLDDDHYTQGIFRTATRLSREGLFALRARIAKSIDMAQLGRPRSGAGFAASCRLAAAMIRQQEPMPWGHH